ncbi:TlpA family protein disulfide reductase [candidate division KSB1 bacterium]|nr:TlpA family protein disulfide reductase [candidate division KSB1 bacterium]
MRNHILILVILMMFSLNVYGQIEAYYDSLRVEMTGNELPNIVFADSLGNKFDLQSLKGTIVAINIWAFGCKPCIKEIPELNKLVEKYNDQVIFISLLGDGKGPFNDKINKQIKEIKFKYNTLSTDKKLSDAYGLLMIFPTHIIIDKNGKVLDLILGPQVDKIENIIKNNL